MILRAGLNLRPSPRAASSRACLSSISLCRHLLNLNFLAVSHSFCSSRRRPWVLSLCRFSVSFPSFVATEAGSCFSCSVYINGSVTGASYLVLGFGLGGRTGSGASTRTTCGPFSRAGSGFSKIGPAGNTGSGSRSSGCSTVTTVGSACSALFTFAFFAFAFFTGRFRFGFFLILTFFKFTFSVVSTVVIFSPSLNHSRIVAAKPTDITDIWFLMPRPSA
ncbi:hypothetical protein ES703_124576 [subsurface metagenome]